jgi:putative DNA primase/helicase
MNNAYIQDKETFTTTAVNFFNELFEPALNGDYGNIEIRVFPKGQAPQQYFCKSESEAASKSYALCNEGFDVYFGVNPRMGNKGTKENVRYVSTFHCEIDYGSVGHKKETAHGTYEEALDAIQNFSPQPTLVNHSGGGFHCYWVLNNPPNVQEVGLSVIEGINISLSQKLGGDRGTQDISRVLRVPGTFNFKQPDNPRQVTSVAGSHVRYDFKDFEEFIPLKEPVPVTPKVKKTETPIPDSKTPTTSILNKGAIPEKIMNLIKHGNDGSYPSRSEADMAVVLVLIHKGYSDAEIKEIFSKEPIGEKYREHPKKDAYLTYTIQAAREMSNLTEEEMQNPLFITGAIIKTEKSYHLKILKFQEFMVKKYQMGIFESTFFRFNGKCYEICPDEWLNNLCQKELSNHRNLFTKGNLKDFVHFAIGDALMSNDKAKDDQVSYLTLQNGLYGLREEKLLPHSPKTFTTNLLPYNFDPDAQCPRFLQYLNEVFMGNQGVISFIQEAVGYGFHKSIPMPALFFLVGDGSNGKSVFINTITNLYGEDNTCSISFNTFSNEYYLQGLFGKMINISSETPQKRQINTDIIKAVVAGDWVTGRIPYKPPTKFRPYAKHYLAMNKIPIIEDTSHGMWRRIYIVEFPRKFSKLEMDVDLTDKLTGELSGIFNWAIAGYQRLRNKQFRFTEVQSMESSKQHYKNDSNTVLGFAAEYLAKSTSKEDKMKFSDVYHLYEQFCLRESIKEICSKKEFRKTLTDGGFIVESSTKDGNQVFIYGVKSVL